jgi:DNA-binding response OmpR family regulator
MDVSILPVEQECIEPRRLLSATMIEDGHAMLRRVLADEGWQVVEAFSCRDARRLVAAHEIPVVICGVDLCDRDWMAFLADTRTKTDPPELILSTPGNRTVWREALKLGCNDVLAWPYEAREVRRVVYLAWDAWNRAREKALPRPPAVLKAQVTHTRYRSAGSAR